MTRETAMQHTDRRSFGDNGVPANGNETNAHSTEESTMSTSEREAAKAETTTEWRCSEHREGPCIFEHEHEVAEHQHGELEQREVTKWRSIETEGDDRV